MKGKGEGGGMGEILTLHFKLSGGGGDSLSIKNNNDLILTVCRFLDPVSEHERQHRLELDRKRSRRQRGPRIQTLDWESGCYGYESRWRNHSLPSP